MLKLGDLELGGIPRLVVGFDDENASHIHRAKRDGLDIAEIRIDQFKSYYHKRVVELVNDLAIIPTIATIRSKSEGGHWSGSDEQRLELFRAVLPVVDAIDVELQSEAILKSVKPETVSTGKLLIVSYHDFNSTPDPYTLEHISQQAISAGADIVKIATQVSNRDHLHHLTEFCLSNLQFPHVVIGMGGHGLLTRVAFPALGSLMTFGYIGRPTAPGQIPFEQLFEQMRLLYPDFNEAKIGSMGRLEYA